MTIQRQYSLPNCTLHLEGLSDVGTMNPADPRPLMSILINAECRFAGLETTLSGGREFLESLVVTVTRYAQELLSGVHPFMSPNATPWVELERLDATHHRLTVRPPDAPVGSGIEAQLSKEVELSTVQLFDLVEAIDQFFADSQTLPDLPLKLQPITRREVRSGEPMSKQAVPATIGLSGLALAAIAFFFVPIPQVREPADLTPKPASQTSNTQPTPGASPPIAANPSPTASTRAADPDLARLEANLSAPEITDADQLDALGKQLKTQVDQAWDTRSGFEQDLVYRLGVSKTGAIVGYKPVNPAALNNAQKTPLLNLLNRQPPPAPSPEQSPEPIAQYKVVFTPDGVLDVSPWREATVSTPTSPQARAEITNSKQLEEIYPKLRSRLYEAWKVDKLAFKRELTYQVRVKPDGSVLDYKPNGQPAIEAVKDTPLPNLGKPADDSTPPQEPYAVFRTVFRPNGTVEVSPWRGWQ